MPVNSCQYLHFTRCITDYTYGLLVLLVLLLTALELARELVERSLILLRIIALQTLGLLRLLGLCTLNLEGNS